MGTHAPASAFGWLDFGAAAFDRAATLLRAFEEPGTLDPIGLGSIRDVLSDVLAPGTSTIQTRLRYFLVVPWTCGGLERQRVTPGASTALGEEHLARPPFGLLPHGGDLPVERATQTGLEIGGVSELGLMGTRECNMPEPGHPSDNTTLSEVLGGFEAAGYAGQFEVASASSVRCDTCGQESPPAQLTVAERRRLEGASDPDDMLSILALECPRCGAKGTLGYFGTDHAVADAKAEAATETEAEAGARNQRARRRSSVAMDPGQS